MTGLHDQLKNHIRELFDRNANTYDQIGPRFFSHFGRNLVDLANIKPGATVLDVATGRGAVLFPAVQSVGPNGSVVGIDLSPEMVKRTRLEAEQRAFRNIDVECMDAEELKFPDNTFDYVLCGLSLSFFPELGKALSEFKRVLKLDGELAVSIWGPGDQRWSWIGDVYEKFKPFFLSDPNITPAHFHEASTLTTALKDAGFHHVHTFEDQAEFVYADAEEWWNVQWSHVNRSVLESIQPEALDDFKEALFQHLQSVREPDGIHQSFCVIHALARKNVAQ